MGNNGYPPSSEESLPFMAKQKTPEPEQTADTSSEAAPPESASEAPSEPNAEECAQADAPAGVDEAAAAEPDLEQAEREELEPTEIELLKAEVNELTTKLIEAESRLNDAQKDVGYAKAETQTAIRRGREDAARALNRAKRDIMNRLMVVADTFHHTTVELEKLETDDRTEMIVSAVQMAIKEFDKTLQGEGLELMNPVGDAFDPQHHEAQATVPTAEHEPGTIMDVLRVGYMLNGNLLRAPQVVVAAELKNDEPAAEESAS